MKKNSHFGLCFTKMKRSYREKNGTYPESGAANFKSLLYVNTVPISSVMVRKNLLQGECIFSECTKVGANEDYEFLLRCAQITEFGFLDEFLIKYWSDENRTSSLYRKDFKSISSFYISIINIYWMIYKTGKSQLRNFVGPVFFLSFICFKQVSVVILQKLRLKN